MALGKLSTGEWCDQFYRDIPLKKLNDSTMMLNGSEYTSADWISGREIRVFGMPNVNDSAIYSVRRGVKGLVDEVGLDINVNVCPIDRETKKLVDRHTSRSGLDYVGLSNALATESYRMPELGGKQHADVLITREFFDDDKISWGDSRFTTGTILLALPGNRQNNLGYLENIARHETGHLLGYPLHHDDIDVPELDNSPDCLMGATASKKDLCNKCHTAIDQFWAGLENLTGEKYFKE